MPFYFINLLPTSLLYTSILLPRRAGINQAADDGLLNMCTCSASKETCGNARECEGCNKILHNAMLFRISTLRVDQEMQFLFLLLVT